ncbi:MAG TPA: peptidase domain-containing ABC transporter [Caldimonas sp.]|jgi:ATP-binding cassette subfamily B protein RaxB|nr:peptidase domain-containing ABC transporter [Caldimonas sp.]HEX2540777.1 peptidase domain-containing ABC transporter [Caldimonas sp.]
MMRPVLQAEGSECSLACLAMICAAHGLHLDLADLRRRFATSLKGATMQQVVAHAGALGFASRPLRLELDQLDQLALPCILHWDLNHFVVLKKVGRRRTVILDPAVGERRLTRAEVSRHFTGIALELTPNADFQPKKASPRLALRQLTGPVRGLTRSLGQVFVVAAVLELFALAAPLFNQAVVDDVLTSGDRDLLVVLALGFGLLILAQAAIGLARSWMVMVLGQNLHLQWATNVFAHLVRLPVDFFERRHLGDVVSRFGAVGTIQRTLTTTVIEAVIDGVMALGALALMLLYSWKLCLLAIAAVALYGAARRLSFRASREATAERLVVAAKENTHFLESLRAMTPLKLFGREEDRRSRWQNLFIDVQNRDVRLERIRILLANGKTFVIAIEMLIVFGWGASFVMAGQSGQASVFTVGMLLAFIAYNFQWMTRVTALIDHGAELSMLRLHAERLADIALTPPERDLPLERDLGHLEPSLELRDVSFRYGEGEPWILRHASFVLPAGQSVAVTGASGCGKTTLLKILLGLLPPTEGEVLYGGIPIAQLGIGNVRRQLGAVMQEDVLLTGSLGDNITFFDAHPDIPRGEACARLAQVHDDIVRMPMGYQTLVGDLGTGLSGGQKQRLLLARALYKQPKVLALDEATSHLDVGNERAVTNALGQLPLTRLVIAHRPETISGAQRVVLVKDGKVVEIMRAVAGGDGGDAAADLVPSGSVGPVPA